METITNEPEETDRISELPESIIHHILSFFNTLHASPAELVRMSVLSKTWLNLTASFPILSFSSNKLRTRQSFFKYVEYTTSRFCHQNDSAHTFKLNVNIQNPAEFDVLGRCLELVLNKGVKVLEVGFTYYPMFAFSKFVPKYRLPGILLSVSVLESLTISGCELPSSLIVDPVKFKSLTRLTLDNVHIDDGVIKYLTDSCPLLQELNIVGCYGFKRFCVYRHQNLQKIGIYYDTRVERIDIEAPNLSHLVVKDLDEGHINERWPPLMNLASCKKLITMTYSGTWESLTKLE